MRQARRAERGIAHSGQHAGRPTSRRVGTALSSSARPPSRSTARAALPAAARACRGALFELCATAWSDTRCPGSGIAGRPRLEAPSRLRTAALWGFTAEHGCARPRRSCAGGERRTRFSKVLVPVAVYSRASPQQFNTVGPSPPLSLRVLTPHLELSPYVAAPTDPLEGA